MDGPGTQRQYPGRGRLLPGPSALAAQPANPHFSGNSPTFELSKQFSFEAAHTLRRNIDAASSRRIHGHSYKAEVTIRGERDANGMLLDLAFFARAIEAARDGLDHHFLHEVPNLAPPPSRIFRLDLAHRRARLPWPGARRGLARIFGRPLHHFGPGAAHV